MSLKLTTICHPFIKVTVSSPLGRGSVVTNVQPCYTRRPKDKPEGCLAPRSTRSYERIDVALSMSGVERGGLVVTASAHDHLLTFIIISSILL
ncbi:hypothetical protein V3C99_012646 [Haemonchus contortus]|uniref:Uncharacterized protein n=1 Tax=Haemonchus contortus TaxID=6289 RepID=A0A7I4Y2Q0_HAECO